MKAIRVLSVLTMVLLSAGFLSPVHAQSKAIDVAGVTLRLGMSIEEVQKQLEPTRYQLQAKSEHRSHARTDTSSTVIGSADEDSSPRSTRPPKPVPTGDSVNSRHER